MPILDPHHDLGHPVEANTAWSESYYFNGYDPPSDTGFFTRVGIRPNEGTMDVGMSVWLPDGRVGEFRAVREQHEMVDTTLTVGAVTYDMLDPLRSWRLRMDGPVTPRACGPGAGGPDPAAPLHVELDLTFSALTPGIGTDGQTRGDRSSDAAAQAAESTGKGHLEQAGRLAGHLSIDGVRHDWSEGRGNRDRSWGPRRWGGPQMWRWFSINVGDDVHFGGIRIGTAAGDLHRGWVWQDGRATSIRHWQVDTETEDDGLTHKVTHVVASDKSGREHHLRGELLRVACIGRPAAGNGGGTVVNEGLARWAYQGRTGYGIAEYLHQLDAHGRPVVPVE